MNPSYFSGPDYGQGVAKAAVCVAVEKGDESFLDASGAGGIDLEADDAGVLGQLRDGPISEMFIKRNEDAIVLCTILQYLQIVRAGHTHFGSALDVIASLAQNLRHRAVDHLVQEEAHGASTRPPVRVRCDRSWRGSIAVRR